MRLGFWVGASLLCFAACGGKDRDFGIGYAGAGGTAGSKGGSGGSTASGGVPAAAGKAGSAGSESAGISGTAGSSLPEGGEGGDLGEAGAGGTPGTVDCDLPCSTTDSVNCEARCRVTNGKASCVVQGKDADKDGYLSKACVTNPGDDCNDANKAIHPGAAELCDRIDNDCNGSIDVNDGVKVSGTNRPIGDNVRFPYIASAPERSVYAIAYRGKDNAGYFETLDGTGAVKVAPKSFSADVSDLDIGWGGNTFAVASGDSAGVLTLQTVSSDGIFGTPTTVVTPSPGTTFNPYIAHTSSGWAVVFTARDFNNVASLNAKTVSDSGVVSPAGLGTKLADGAAFDVSLAALNNQLILGYVINATVTNILTPTFTTQASLGVSGAGPEIGVGSNEFAIAVKGATSSDLPQFYAFSPSGTQKCGPVKFGRSAAVNIFSVVATSKGYLIGWSSSGNRAEIQEVLSDCSLGQNFTLEESQSSNIEIAASSAGFAVVWTGDEGATYRVFGPNFCD